MALERLFDSSEDSAPEALYEELDFPQPPEARPYTVINMVATVDGKTLIAERGTTAKGLGSGTDQLLMRRIQAAVQSPTAPTAYHSTKNNCQSFANRVTGEAPRSPAVEGVGLIALAALFVYALAMVD